MSYNNGNKGAYRPIITITEKELLIKLRKILGK